MNKQAFANAIRIMVESLPTTNVDKRVNSLYEFYQKETFETLEAAAQKAARNLERFPTPKVFGDYVGMVRRAKPAQVAPWVAKPRLSDGDFVAAMMQHEYPNLLPNLVNHGKPFVFKGDISKQALGCLVLTGGDPEGCEIEAVRKSWIFAQEILGEKGLAKVRKRFEAQKRGNFYRHIPKIKSQGIAAKPRKQLKPISE